MGGVSVKYFKNCLGLTDISIDSNQHILIYTCLTEIIAINLYQKLASPYQYLTNLDQCLPI